MNKHKGKSSWQPEKAIAVEWVSLIYGAASPIQRILGLDVDLAAAAPVAASPENETKATTCEQAET